MTRPAHLRRCFLDWLDEAHQRLAVPLCMQECRGSAQLFAFEGLTPALLGCLVHQGIDVSVEWRGVCWDLVYSDSVAAAGRRGAYHCLNCPKEARETFPSRAALWRGHLFEPFLQWVNGTLAPADRIALYGGDEWARGEPGWSSARLIRPDEDRRYLDGALAVLPLRSAPLEQPPK